MTTGLCNLRDVGGLPLVGGGTVREGVLFRGDAPMVGDEDPELQPWPPASVIDLRSDDERAVVDTSRYWSSSTPVLEVSLMAEANPNTWADDDTKAPLMRLREEVLRLQGEQ